jgi:FkbM family methyltransferase
MMKKVAKKLLRRLLQFRKVNSVVFGKNKGFKFRFNEDLNLDMMLGIHEPNSFEVFDLFVKEGMIVVDIGANIGYFSRFLSIKTGQKGKVFAFEPIPNTFKRLVETTELNRLVNITLINSAVSNSNTNLKMFLSHTHYMASLDGNWAGNDGGEIEVQGVTLDSYFESKGFYPDFIKMDIEGGGVYALPGMTNCILKNQPVLFLESHTPSEDVAIGKALSMLPYDVYRVGDSREVKHLDTDYKDELGIYGTVIAIPKSKVSLFGNWTPAVFQKDRVGQR